MQLQPHSQWHGAIQSVVCHQHLTSKAGEFVVHCCQHCQGGRLKALSIHGHSFTKYEAYLPQVCILLLNYSQYVCLTTQGKLVQECLNLTLVQEIESNVEGRHSYETTAETATLFIAL